MASPMAQKETAGPRGRTGRCSVEVGAGGTYQVGAYCMLYWALAPGVVPQS